MPRGMTLNQAIKHCEEKAAELGCTECGKEHLKLAGWLKELKRWRRLFADPHVYYLPVTDNRGPGCRNDMPTIKDLIKNMEDEEDENAH